MSVESKIHGVSGSMRDNKNIRNGWVVVVVDEGGGFSGFTSQLVSMDSPIARCVKEQAMGER